MRTEHPIRSKADDSIDMNEDVNEDLFEEVNESLHSSELYNQLFISWSNRWERIIRILIVSLLFLLLLSQALLQWPLFRTIIVKVERLEGVPYFQHNNSPSPR